jgi:hypothetical protein
MGGTMMYLVLRMRCLVQGHDWRETSSPVGIYDRCWRCYSEREPSTAEGSLPQG